MFNSVDMDKAKIRSKVDGQDRKLICDRQPGILGRPALEILLGFLLSLLKLFTA